MWCHFQPIGAQGCSLTRARARSVCSPSSICPEDLGVFIVMNRVLLSVAFQTNTPLSFANRVHQTRLFCPSRCFCKPTRVQTPMRAVSLVRKIYYWERIVHLSTFTHWYHFILYDVMCFYQIVSLNEFYFSSYNSCKLKFNCNS